MPPVERRAYRPLLWRGWTLRRHLAGDAKAQRNGHDQRRYPHDPPALSAVGVPPHKGKAGEAGNGDARPDAGEHPALQPGAIDLGKPAHVMAADQDQHPGAEHAIEESQDEPGGEIAGQTHAERAGTDGDQRETQKQARRTGDDSGRERADQVSEKMPRGEPSAFGDADQPVGAHHRQQRGEGETPDTNRHGERDETYQGDAESGGVRGHGAFAAG